MTLEELKAEAKRQGYNLVPKPKPKEKALPCPVCGMARMNSFWGLTIPYGNDSINYTKWGIVERDSERDYRYVHCNKCAFDGPKAYGTRVKDQDAIKAWNEHIRRGETYWDEHP